MSASELATPLRVSVTGPYSTHSGTTPPPVSAPRASVADDGMPVGYVIASAFFLAIAVVGFGVWLAFAVISL
jgi:hypothetical protein